MPVLITFLTVCVLALTSPGCVEREVRSKSYGSWSALGEDSDVARAPTVEPQARRMSRVVEEEDDFDPLGDMWSGVKNLFGGGKKKQEVRRMKIERKTPSGETIDGPAEEMPEDDDAPGGSDVPPLFD